MSSRRIVLAALFALLGFGILRVLLHRAHDELLLWILVAGVLLGIGAAIASGRLEIAERSWVVVAPRPPAVLEHPFRGAIPALASTRRLSARLAATLLSASLFATALGIPFLLHRSRWIELEAVLLGWWVIWVLILAIVASRGVETVDDWSFAIRVPWRRPRPPAGPRRKRSVVWDVLGAIGELDVIVVVVVVFSILALAFAGAWVIAEIVGPALFFVAYVALLAALRRIQRDERHATIAAVKWATAYVGPLALGVWLVHVV